MYHTSGAPPESNRPVMQSRPVLQRNHHQPCVHPSSKPVYDPPPSLESFDRTLKSKLHFLSSGTGCGILGRLDLPIWFFHLFFSEFLELIAPPFGRQLARSSHLPPALKALLIASETYKVMSNPR